MFTPDSDFQVWLATPDAAERLDETRLSPAEAASWKQTRSVRRRQDWASSRALLANVPTDDPCNRSLTHSHGFAGLLIAHPLFQIGIDIEVTKPRDFLRMAEIAYPANETKYLASLDPAMCRARFYEFWTLKEAFAKALGLPLTEALATCRCLDDSGQAIPAIPTTKPWRAAVFAPRADLRLAVTFVAETLEQLQCPIQIREWPAPALDPWPIVLDLFGTPRTCATETEPSPFARDDSSGHH